MGGMVLRYAVALLLINFATNAQSANVGMAKASNGTFSYRISGTVMSGDYDKLLKLVAKQPSGSVQLNSDGGDLVEAMKIGDLVARLGLGTFVHEGEVCASACFFIWVNGNPRMASAIRPLLAAGEIPVNVGLHRPYLVNPSEQQKSLERQLSGQKLAVSYLDELLIPRRLIDLMMSRPSNDIYWLTRFDTDELGEYTPDIEELLIVRCAYDRRQFDFGKVYELRKAGRVAEADKTERQMHSADECSWDVLGARTENLRSEVLKQRPN